MSWQVAVRAGEAAVDVLADLLESRGAAVETCREGDAAVAVGTFTGEPDLSVVDALGAWLSSLDAVDASVQTRRGPGEPWQPGWRGVFAGLRLSPRLRIVPPWAAETERSAPDVLVVEPDTGFGSGAHPTTSGVLALLERCLDRRPGATVLDVGCGNGLLSLAASRLGASRVVGVEIDAAATAQATRHVALNGLEGRVEIRQGSVERVDGTFDVVVANIYASVLTRLAPALLAHCGGDLLVSGLFESQVAALYAHLPGLVVVDTRVEDGWTSAWLRREDGHPRHG